MSHIFLSSSSSSAPPPSRPSPAIPAHPSRRLTPSFIPTLLTFRLTIPSAARAALCAVQDMRGGMRRRSSLRCGAGADADVDEIASYVVVSGEWCASVHLASTDGLSGVGSGPWDTMVSRGWVCANGSRGALGCGGFPLEERELRESFVCCHAEPLTSERAYI
ncbi:hypothetical protein C8R46DRAFT_1223974 [Mycena filopes]|nr:hypothetical protein C8R46DRAFT_1223974 [Mycena filopes]